MTFFRKDEQLNIWAIASWRQPGQIFGARNQIALTWIYDPPVPVNTGGALSPKPSGTTQSEASAIAVLSEFTQLAW